MKDLVSVVVPTFNRPKGLYQALKSVQNQAYDHVEVLVVNDSKDENPVKEIISKLKDSRFRYLKNQGLKGANGSRNTGIAEAIGSFIAFLDDDDQWLPNKLTYQLEYLQQNPNCIGVFNAYEISGSGKWIIKDPKVSGLSLRDCLLNTVSIGSSSNLLFRANLFSKGLLWDETLKRQQDKDLLVRILAEYEIGYDNRTALKVNGHNDPHPLKSIPGHEIYYDKVKVYLNRLDSKSQRKFHSFHYRRLCMYYLMLANYHKAFSLYKRALKYQKLHLRKDTKNLIYLIRSFFYNKGNVPR